MSDQGSSSGRRGRSDRALRRAARRKRILLGVALLVFVGICLLGARPVYRALKAHRAGQIAAEAEALVQSGKLNEGAAKYRAALELDPLGYQPLSGAARLATRYGRPEAADLWQGLVASPRATNADRQDYAAFLLEQGTMDAAQSILAELLKNAPDTRTLSLASQFASSTGDLDKAVQFARLALKSAPGDDTLRFRLAELLARASTPAEREEARQVLWQIVEKENPHRRAAIEALARAPELPRAEQERVLAALNGLPLHAVTSLLGYDLKLKLQPEAAEQIFADAVGQWAGAEATDVAELTRWLNLHKQSERVLAILPEERALASEPFLLSRLDALGNLERWKEVDLLLAQPELGLDPVVTETFRARSAMAQGLTSEAEAHWDRAFNLARGDAGRLRFVATFAEQSRATAVAVRSYELLARFPEQAAFALRRKAQLTEGTDDAPAARHAAERLSALAPQDANAQGHLAHLNLLLNTEVDSSLEKVKGLIAKDPTRLSFRVAAALGHLRKHDAGGALAQFRGPPIEWEKTPPGWRAVYAAVLAANEEEEKARAIAATIPLERLNREERELIAPILEAR